MDRERYGPAAVPPDHATRHELFDFVVAELRCREPLCPHRIGPVVRALANQRDDLLAFASQRDRDLAVLATEFQVPVETVRAVLNVEILPLGGEKGTSLILTAWIRPPFRPQYQ